MPRIGSVLIVEIIRRHNKLQEIRGGSKGQQTDVIAYFYTLVRLTQGASAILSPTNFLIVWKALPISCGKLEQKITYVWKHYKIDRVYDRMKY